MSNKKITYRRYSTFEKEKKDIEFINLKKIVVGSQSDKDELLKTFKYLHDEHLDSDIIGVNLIMHLYLNPELIIVEE